MPKTNPQMEPDTRSRERLTGAKIFRFLTLPFFPGRLKTYLAVDRLEDISIESLLTDGIEGVLLDADGAMGPHRCKEYGESVTLHVRKMLEQGLRVAIYTNAAENRFHQFPGVGIVTGVAPKPDPQGFLDAMNNFLNLRDPEKVCMIGDNYLTDGGAIGAGMRFIHVNPIKGDENWFHSLTRFIAYLCARAYFPETFRKPAPGAAVPGEVAD